MPAIGKETAVNPSPCVCAARAESKICHRTSANAWACSQDSTGSSKPGPVNESQQGPA